MSHLISASPRIDGLSLSSLILKETMFIFDESSVVDPDVFGHPGPGSVKKFTDRQQKSKKTLISTILKLLFDFLSMKTDENVPSKSNKQKS